MRSARAASSQYLISISPLRLKMFDLYKTRSFAHFNAGSERIGIGQAAPTRPPNEKISLITMTLKTR